MAVNTLTHGSKWIWITLLGFAGATVASAILVTKTADLRYQRDVNRMVVEHEEPFPYQLDGDYLGDVERLQFDFVPDAVRLVFPASAA